ncbi:atrial natriuretic peptide-converting enzyme [Hyalella azteca]|uniref:Atrial natriuretic peptide-converting enzyme n=1 Tax=Hyalella azteca TaxID=294128 RepID=A0A979FNU3_HYAAZ|nr:atrial natriuretic peptide-converting enzyme [Hyalella azteca]
MNNRKTNGSAESRWRDHVAASAPIRAEMPRRNEDFGAPDKKIQSPPLPPAPAPASAPAASLLQRLKQQATQFTSPLPLLSRGPAPQPPKPPTDEGLRKGLIVLGPESTFGSKSYTKYSDIDEKTLSTGVPCMRSDSLTSSELGLSRGRRHHCSRRWCFCLVLAVLFVAIGAAAGIYFAYQFLGLEPSKVQVFKGKLRVMGIDRSITSLRSYGLRRDNGSDRFREPYTRNNRSSFSNLASSRMVANNSMQGRSANSFRGTNTRRGMFDQTTEQFEAPWREALSDTTGEEYLATLRAFQQRMDRIYSTSLFKVAFIRSEILALDRGEEDSLVVHFNLHIDQQKLRLDAADLYIVLLSEIRKSNSDAFAGLQLDEDSLEIEERILSLQNASTMPTDSSIPVHTVEPPGASSLGSNYPSRFATQSSRVLATPSPRVCSKLDLTYCSTLHHNVTTYPNLMGHIDLSDAEKDLAFIREMVDSSCHSLALEFMCEVLQPDCHKFSQPTSRGTFEDELIPPCRDFCEEVMGACRTRLPPHLRLKIDCGKFPLFQDGHKCTAKPGCSRELHLKGWAERVCDGVVDCLDMSDEDHCASCSPGSFRCGGGSQCVSQDRKCDGIEDCANGADERSCLSLTSTPTDESALKDQRWTRYNREGLLRYTEAGDPSRVCVDNINKTLTTREAHQLIHNMAEVTCDLLTYGGVDLVEVVVEDGFDHVPGLGYVQISDVHKSNITFERVNCTKRTVVYMACSELACGVRPLYLSNREPAYIDRVARTAGAGDWPWAAALLKDGLHTCDATLVHPTWLLTTANCFKGHGRALWVARMGSVRISSQAPWVQERLIVGMVKSVVKGSQMVLVKLEEEVQLSDYVRPVCLGSHHNSSQLMSRNCRALGWGTRRDPLIELRANVTSGNYCSKRVLDFGNGGNGPISYASRDVLCGQQKHPTERCLLEEMSGAGLLCEWAGRWEVVGVAVAGTGCNTGARPRVYDDVNPTAVKWIKMTIAAFAKESV